MTAMRRAVRSLDRLPSAPKVWTLGKCWSARGRFRTDRAFLSRASTSAGTARGSGKCGPGLIILLQHVDVKPYITLTQQNTAAISCVCVHTLILNAVERKDRLTLVCDCVFFNKSRTTELLPHPVGEVDRLN